MQRWKEFKMKELPEMSFVGKVERNIKNVKTRNKKAEQDRFGTDGQKS